MGSTIGKWDPLMGMMLGSAQGRPTEYLPGGIDPNHYAPAGPQGPPAGWKPPPGAGTLPHAGPVMPGYVPPGAGIMPNSAPPPMPMSGGAAQLASALRQRRAPTP